MRSLIIFFVVIIAMIGGVKVYWATHPIPECYESAPWYETATPEEVDPVDVIEFWQENPYGAGKRYLQKLVVLSAKVDRVVREGEAGDWMVMLNIRTTKKDKVMEDQGAILCFFDRAHEKEMASLRHGDMVSISGVVSNRGCFHIWLVDVSIEHCRVLSISKGNEVADHGASR